MDPERPRARLGLALLGVFTALGGVAMPLAQEPSPAFQFVSIRFVKGICPPEVLCIGASGLLPSPSPSTVTVLPGGRFEARNQTFENLARLAYGFEGVDPRRGMVDMPLMYGAKYDRFDITAVTDREWSMPTTGETVPDELRVMLRTLLEERFQLKARLQTRKMDVYAVRLSGEEPGPGLRPSTGECLGPYTDPQPVEESKPACPFRLEPNRVEAGALTMPEVARVISRIYGAGLDRPVVDGTALQGIYDLRLSIDLPANLRPLTRFADAGSADARMAISMVSLTDRWPITISEALQQQLGLKLAKAKLPIPTLVIERAKEPKEDQ